MNRQFFQKSSSLRQLFDLHPREPVVKAGRCDLIRCAAARSVRPMQLRTVRGLSNLSSPSDLGSVGGVEIDSQRTVSTLMLLSSFSSKHASMKRARSKDRAVRRGCASLKHSMLKTNKCNAGLESGLRPPPLEWLRAFRAF